MIEIRRLGMRARLLPLAVLAALVLTTAVASASPSATGPLDLTGEINGAPFAIILPADWNGKLIVFAHGYRDKADHLGEVDNRAPFDAGTAPARTALLSQGFGVAGTAYKDNGWAVKEALDDLVALTAYFKDNVAHPERTYLVGFSMGTVPTLKLAERNAGAFDGYLAACSVGAGTPRGSDGLLVAMLAYDVVFGEPTSWGTPGQVREDIDFETEVLPTLFAQVSNPLNFPRFEFIRLVTGTPGRDLIPPPPPAFFPGWVFQDFFFTTEAGGELERRAGGPVVQNLTHTYSLTPAEKAYLAALGIVADPLLAVMNGRRTISAPQASRNYVEHYAEFDGTIKKPVITLHTKIDGLVPVSHESAYRETVEAAGNADLLFQAYTMGVGHCAFTTPQLVTTANALDQWVESGAPPMDAAFPAALGFDQSFVPPAWLQP
jgi:dienelactone hydrolase